MNAAPLAIVTAVAFLFLLLWGRDQIAAGSNKRVANGALLLVLAVVAGVSTVALLTTLDSL